MFKLESFLSPERCLCQAEVASKKRFFEVATELICNDQPGLDSAEVYDALLAREKLGSTALGEGIAIPHCRISTCRSALGSLLTLQQGIDFDAPDRARVDIAFVLLVPMEAEQEHLDILAGLAQRLGNHGFCQGLRAASGASELYRAAVEFEP